MARVSPAPLEIYVPLFGKDAPLRHQIVAHRPEIAKAFGEYKDALIRERLLPARLLELVRLRVAFHNQCRTCMAARHSDGVEDGVTEALVCSLERPEEAPDLTDAERAALHFADLFATDHLGVSDDTFARLRRHFSEAEIIELLFNAALFVGYGRMTAVLHVVEDLPERFRDEQVDRVTPWGDGEVMLVETGHRA